MTWSQENCLINDRRLTCERWGRGFATSLLFLAFGDENIFAYAYEALFRSREGAFLVVKKFSPWFQLYGEALLIHFIQSYVSPLCGESRNASGRSGIPPFFEV